MNGYVYWIQGVETRRVKIGFTGELEHRIYNLRKMCSEPLTLLGVLSCATVFEEKAWHWQLREFNSHGEWFNENADVLASVGRRPSQEMVEATKPWQRRLREAQREARELERQGFSQVGNDIDEWGPGLDERIGSQRRRPNS